jgi:hypothetical protein
MDQFSYPMFILDRDKIIVFNLGYFREDRNMGMVLIALAGTFIASAFGRNRVFCVSPIEAEI